MNISIPLNVIWKGKATSTFTMEMVDSRLEKLKDIDAEWAKEEVKFLQKVKQDAGTSNDS